MRRFYFILIDLANFGFRFILVYMGRFLGYLSNFSSSFLLAILIWPFLAALLTLPILIYQYRKYNKIVFHQAVMIYLFMLYALGLFSFALYPMPDNAAEFCQTHTLWPQLQPLNFISDIRSDGMKALLQIIMNFFFFLPFGMFAKVMFKWKFSTTLIVSALGSLLIETAQLTGLFGFYPCGYRLFDVDDILINTLGGVAGYLFALLIPVKNLEKADKSDVVKNAGPIRYLVSFILDNSVAYIAFTILITISYLIFGNDITMEIKDYLLLAVILIFHTLIPYFAKGWSLGGLMVRLNHDDKDRKIVKRTFYYILRTLYILVFTYFSNAGLSLLMLIVTFICWRKTKKLPYQLL